MREVILRSPEATVNEHCGGERTFAFRHTEIAEVEFSASVVQPNVCWWRRVGKDVFAILHPHRGYRGFRRKPMVSTESFVSWNPPLDSKQTLLKSC
jgi:hypothetical protein